ncbi:unnamed protein product [Arctogadus glacialis]
MWSPFIDFLGADCTPRGFNRAGLELQVDGGQEPFSPTGTDGRGDGGGRLEVLVWSCSPWRSSGGGRLEVRGGRLEVLAVRSMAVVWRRSLQVEGRPGAVQPNGCRTKGLEAANLEGLETANLEGLETAEVLEATAGLEVEANLEVLESVGLEAAVRSNLEGLEAVVGTNLEVPAVASTWRRSAWRARRRSAWRARRRSAWRARRRSAWRARWRSAWRARRRSAWRARRRRSAWRARRRRLLIQLS